MGPRGVTPSSGCSWVSVLVCATPSSLVPGAGTVGSNNTGLRELSVASNLLSVVRLLAATTSAAIVFSDDKDCCELSLVAGEGSEGAKPAEVCSEGAVVEVEGKEKVSVEVKGAGERWGATADVPSEGTREPGVTDVSRPVVLKEEAVTVVGAIHVGRLLPPKPKGNEEALELTELVIEGATVWTVSLAVVQLAVPADSCGCVRGGEAEVGGDSWLPSPLGEKAELSVEGEAWPVSTVMALGSEPVGTPWLCCASAAAPPLLLLLVTDVTGTLSATTVVTPGLGGGGGWERPDWDSWESVLKEREEEPLLDRLCWE